MTDATTSSRPPRPLPSGWSDSSDDENHGNGAAAGGGFDDSSSDGGWGGGGGGGGGGMRAFERRSAERTRRALLENDEKLCEAPKLPLRQQQPQQQQDGSDGSQESEGTKRQAVGLKLRHVPGDPFANEEADVGAWAKHFTYLSVVPIKGGGGGGGGGGADPETMGETAESGGAKGGSMVSNTGSEEGSPGSEEGSPHHVGGPSDTMEVEERSHGRGAAGGGEASRGRPSRDGEAAAAAAAAVGAEAASTEAAAGRDPAAVAERETVAHGEQKLREEDRSEEQAEEVFASHGVYEEYLAYDRRPPGANDERDDGGRTAADAFVGSTTAAVASAEHGGWMSDKQATGAATAAPRRARPRLDTPRRELRQEIMDRLFDELWGRITPELLQLVQPVPPTALGGSGSNGAAGSRIGSQPEAPRDSMED